MQAFSKNFTNIKEREQRRNVSLTLILEEEDNQWSQIGVPENQGFQPYKHLRSQICMKWNVMKIYITNLYPLLF